MSFEVRLRHRLGGFDLDVAFKSEGGVTALFGRSGAGKTTVVKMIAGLMTPQSGRIALGGRLFLDTERGIDVQSHKRRLGYVFQEGRLFPHLTVAQNLGFGGWFAPRTGASEPASRERVIDLLGIGHLLQRKPLLLSGGEQQRVAIGRALLSRPEALLMDEPLGSLDEQRKADILPFLERLRDEIRIPILYVSHSIPEVARLATTVVLLVDGSAERIGAASEILADPGLFPAVGRHEAGAILPARIIAHDNGYGLSTLEVSGGIMIVPHVDAAPGSRLRLYVRARDIILATRRPEGISALNILPATVAEIGAVDRPIVDVRLQSGTDSLLARITRRSLDGLSIRPGLEVFAILKSIAVGRRDIGIEVPGEADQSSQTTSWP